MAAMLNVTDLYNSITTKSFISLLVDDLKCPFL